LSRINDVTITVVDVIFLIFNVFEEVGATKLKLGYFWLSDQMFIY